MQTNHAEKKTPKCDLPSAVKRTAEKKKRNN